MEVAVGWVQTRTKNLFMAVGTNALAELMLDILHTKQEAFVLAIQKMEDATMMVITWIILRMKYSTQVSDYCKYVLFL